MNIEPAFIAAPFESPSFAAFPDLAPIADAGIKRDSEGRTIFSSVGERLLVGAGDTVGIFVGLADGDVEGVDNGLDVGVDVGSAEGDAVGSAVGDEDGYDDG